MTERKNRRRDRLEGDTLFIDHSDDGQEKAYDLNRVAQLVAFGSSAEVVGATDEEKTLAERYKQMAMLVRLFGSEMMAHFTVLWFQHGEGSFNYEDPDWDMKTVESWAVYCLVTAIGGRGLPFLREKFSKY